jgi:uncharacterized protein
MQPTRPDYARKAVVTGEIISDEILPARAYWHKRLDKGTVLRIVDLEGCQSVDTLIYDAADTAVRYNAANTMKLAGSVYLSKGCVIYDDLAQPLMTMIEDTVGRHDTLAGNCSREINFVRYGKPGPLSCRDNFITALGELGMGPRDIPANINFFMNVPVTGNGDLAITDGICRHLELSARTQSLLRRSPDAYPPYAVAAKTLTSACLMRHRPCMDPALPAGMATPARDG